MKIIVIGGSGGIGAGLLGQLQMHYPDAQLFATWYRSAPPNELAGSGVHWSQLDISNEESIRAYASQFEKVHWLISAVGLLHTENCLPEKSIDQIDPDFFLSNMQINALSALLLAKHFKPALKHEEAALMAVISAKVGSIEDNRLGGWHSYRCAKAALNMAIKNISIEWRRTMQNVCVAALHPGTTDTKLSLPFQRNVPPGKLFTTEYTAECLLKVITRLQPSDTGKFLSFNGEELPW